ncbi:DUF3524 domain-containing protein [Marinobacter daepoensis]|uniref:tRNA-queuosine alpha-mannosyltransferase n=1 Tax=Marinobacter daepoensis TaxID=262077 RepID=A0ABS3BEE4_9GAMM|nr:DUF3524 domain-containing protein [Marinobacter daepoensis]MBN7770208.1 DUF3524 domain-containing protein [Marinobacter daepoensis]MBY6079654.1 DUF3524 domain-containing protein [Marinobacter daepoensis]
MTFRILLLSAYDAASHRRWRDQLVAMFPDYHWHALTLAPRFFQWRIRGNPVSWLNEPCLAQTWDLVIATSMVDLATLRGLHPHLANTPCLLYMHENQFAFPVSGRQQGRVEPKMVNLYSALAADTVVFNSAWNRDSFLRGVEGFLNQMPDAVPRGLVQRLKDRARVLPVPIEDRLFTESPRTIDRECPHLLWNHRWEYDKGPDRLFAFLEQLEQRQCAYRISIVGEGFRGRPEAFDRIHQRFGDRILRWGFLDNRADYDRLLGTADIVVSTALHDFQGLAMLEAMAAGCLPLAPDRLAYREYVPSACRYASLESDVMAEAHAAAERLQKLLRQPPELQVPHDWRASELCPKYQALIEALAAPDQ